MRRKFIVVQLPDEKQQADSCVNCMSLLDGKGVIHDVDQMNWANELHLDSSEVIGSTCKAA